MTLLQLFHHSPSLFNLAISEAAYQANTEPKHIDIEEELKNLIVFKDSPNIAIWMWLNNDSNVHKPIQDVPNFILILNKRTLASKMQPLLKSQLLNNLKDSKKQLTIALIGLSKEMVNNLTIQESLTILGAIEKPVGLDFIFEIFDMD